MPAAIHGFYGGANLVLARNRLLLNVLKALTSIVATRILPVIVLKYDIGIFHLVYKGTYVHSWTGIAQSV